MKYVRKITPRMALFTFVVLLVVWLGLLHCKSILIFPGQGRGGDCLPELEERAKNPLPNRQAGTVTNLPSGNKTWFLISSPEETLPAPTDNERRIVLFFYGNCGRLDWYDSFAQPFLTCGVDFACIEWPGYGVAQGRPSERSCDEVALALWDTVCSQYGYRPENIFIAGYSMGAGVACNLALQKQSAGLLLFSAFTSLRAIAHYHFPFLPTRLLLSNQFDNRSKLQKMQCPILLAHGTADTIVPYSMAHENEQAARQSRQYVSFYSLSGSDHELFDEPDEFLFQKVVNDFLHEHRDWEEPVIPENTGKTH